MDAKNLEDGNLRYGQPLEDDDVLRFFESCKEESEERFLPIWRENEKLSNAYFGETLGADDIAYLNETGRPPVSINVVLGTVNAVLGSDMASRREVRFEGDDGSSLVDDAVADLVTDTVRKAMGKCGGHREEARALLDLLIGGYAFTEGYLDVTEIPSRAVLSHVPWWENLPDPNAVKGNLLDRRFHIRMRKWTLEEAQSRWPDKANEIENLGLSGSRGILNNSATVRQTWKSVASPRKKHGVAIFEFQYYRLEPRVLYFDQQKRRHDVTPEEFAAAQEESVDPITGEVIDIEYFPYSGKTYYKAFIAAAIEGSKKSLLSHEPIGFWTYNAATGFVKSEPAKEQVRFFGISRVIHDLQMYINKIMSVRLEILSRGAKGGGLFEQGAVDDPDKFIKDRSKPGAWTAVNDGAISGGLIQHSPVQSDPSGFSDLIQVLLDLVSFVTGVTDWVKGTAEQERSNVLISNLQSQSMVMLEPIMDQNTVLRMENGKLLAKIIAQYMPPIDLESMVGDQGIEGINFVMVPGPDGQPQKSTVDPQTGMEMEKISETLRRVDVDSYSVTVDIGEATATHKQAVWSVLQQGVLKSLVDAGIDITPIVPMLIKNMPLPGMEAKEASEKLEANLQQQELLKTTDGILQALLGLGIDQAAQVIQQAAQQLQQMAQQQQPQQPQA